MIILKVSSFRIWNSSAGVPLPLLSLFVIMLPKAHLTSHSRMSGSRWVTILLWLSRSLRPFLHQFSSVAQLCPTLQPHEPQHARPPCPSPTPGVHPNPWVGDAIQPSHPLSSPFPPTLNLSQHQGLFKWVSSSHQVAKVLEFQLQH